MVVSLSQQDEFSQITLSSPQEKDALLHSLIAMDVSIERFEVMEPTLEEIFVEKAGDSLWNNWALCSALNIASIWKTKRSV